MKQKSLILLLFIFCSGILHAQERVFTKNGNISFYSEAPMETIEASNKNVTCVLDTKSGQVQFAVLMRGFEFRKALMQEHFNENYVESTKFPKAEFKGQIVNNADINYSKDGSYTATVTGKLTIHGESRDIQSQGTVKVTGGKVTASTIFNILLADYKISIPALVKDKVSNNVRITVNCPLEPLKN
ncbi:MAG: YceI family protein [Chitinophagaceae bacterium]|nr:YceI family protein [Chitinophagaceae bacterium]